MARPANWKELIREHGWGSTPERLAKHTRRRPGSSCVEWYRKVAAEVPQIRVSVGPRGAKIHWVDAATRVAWMLKRGLFVPDDQVVKRTCCNPLCLEHLVLGENGVPASLCVLRKTQSAALASARKRRSIHPSTLYALRRRLKAGETDIDIAQALGLSREVVYMVRNGMLYNETPGGGAAARRRQRERVSQRIRRRTTREIRDEIRASKMPLSEIAEKYRVTEETAYNIINFRGAYARDLA